VAALLVKAITLTDTQLADILDTFDSSSPTGRRDHAMALCLVGLGLRVAEVAALTLSDVDSSASTLRLVGGKTQRDRLLPMPPSVRRAVLHYIRHDRPTPGQHLFVRHRIPLGEPVTRELIRGVIRRAYARVAGCERLPKATKTRTRPAKKKPITTTKKKAKKVPKRG
jgi:integrase/recombinase XerD